MLDEDRLLSDDALHMLVDERSFSELFGVLQGEHNLLSDCFVFL